MTDFVDFVGEGMFWGFSLTWVRRGSALGVSRVGGGGEMGLPAAPVAGVMALGSGAGRGAGWVPGAPRSSQPPRCSPAVLALGEGR